MRFAFHPEARAEYLDAVAHYEQRQQGLGTRFTREIEDAIQRIVSAPMQWHAVNLRVRRCLAHTFPYGVLYSVEPDCILLLAVMHHSREPGYWLTRMR